MAVSKKRQNQLILHWALLTGGSIGLYWLIRYITNGFVPEATSVEVSENISHELPFIVSRWWDIVIGPIWSTITILLIIKIDEIDKKSSWNLTPSLVQGQAISMILSLAICMLLGMTSGFGLVYGLVFGIVLSLVLSTAVGLVYLIVIIVYHLWPILKANPVYKTLTNWLMARSS